MKRLVFALCLGVMTCNVAVAKPVKNLDQAIDMVIKSVKKNKLLSIPIECVSFGEREYNVPTYYEIEVKEIHNEKCGGDPQNSPILFIYRVDKKEGLLRTNAIATPCYINKVGNQLHYCRGEVGDYLVPIDPVSPIIVYDPPKKMKTK